VLKLIDEANSHNPLSRLNHLLFLATWMRGRRLLDQLHDILDEAQKIAHEHEYFQEEIKVHQHWKFLFNIAPGKIDATQVAARIAELNAMNVQAIELELIADELQLKKMLMNSPGREIGEIASLPHLSDVCVCTSARARVHFHRAWINIHISRKDYKLALSAISDLVSILSGKQHFLSDPAMSGIYYQYAFSGVQVALALGLKKEEEAFNSLLIDGTLHRTDPAKYFEYTSRIWLWKTELGANLSKEDLEKLAGIQTQLNVFKNQLGDGADIALSHHAAVLLMAKGYPGKAIPWIIRYQLTRPGLHRPDLVCYSYILFVLAKFELDEPDMVVRGKRTALNFISKYRFHIYFFESLLKGLVKCSNLEGKNERKAALAALRSETEECLRQPEAALANSFFDHLKWMDKMILLNSK
jgi:hypothetical protein